MIVYTKTPVTLVAGLLAGLTASACCAGPLLLLTLGVSGSWIGNLSALEPIRPYVIAIAVFLLVLAYRKIYKNPQSCSVDKVCASEQGKLTQHILFLVTVTIVILSISFPWYAPFIFD